MTDLHNLDHLARRQHSLLTTRQLNAAGLSNSQVQRLVQRGELIRVRRGVMRTMGGPITREQSWMAATLAAEGECLLSHGCAAALWDFRRLAHAADGGIDLLTDGPRPGLAGVRAHMTRHLPDRHRTRRNHIPVTSAARTLIDTCGLISFVGFERTVDTAMRQKKLRLPDLARCAEEVPLSGRRRIRPVKLLLAGRVKGYDPGGSNEELDVLRTLKRAGFPLPVQQYRVELEGRTMYLDFAWPETMHCLEYQGKHWHDMKSDFDRDYERFRILQRSPWTPWPLTKSTSANELCAIGEIACADLLAA